MNQSSNRRGGLLLNRSRDGQKAVSVSDAGRHLRRAALASAAVLVLALVAGCGSSGSGGSGSAGTKKLDKITISLAHLELGPFEEVYMYAVPKAIGLFAKNGVDAALITADGSTAALQRLGTNDAQIAFAGPLATVGANAKGLPVMTYAGQSLNFPYKLAVLEGSPITTVADLKGKTIGVTSLASNTYLTARAKLHAAGLNPDTDVHIVVVGSATSSLAALQGHKVDAIANFSDNFDYMKSTGAKLTFLPDDPDEQGLFDVAFNATKANLTNDQEKDVIARATRAMFEGMLWSIVHPVAAMHIGCKEFPSIDCTGDNFKSNVDLEVGSFAGVSPPFTNDGTPQSGGPETYTNWGFLTDDQWKNEVSFAFNAGASTKLMDVSQVWDPSLLPEINKIDNKAVLAIPAPSN
jgi:NitT/TauT family transport system substrate-binding protein